MRWNYDNTHWPLQLVWLLPQRIFSKMLPQNQSHNVLLRSITDVPQNRVDLITQSASNQIWILDIIGFLIVLYMWKPNRLISKISLVSNWLQNGHSWILNPRPWCSQKLTNVAKVHNHYNHLINSKSCHGQLLYHQHYKMVQSWYFF